MKQKSIKEMKIKIKKSVTALIQIKNLETDDHVP